MTSENNCVKTNKDRHMLSAVQIFGRDRRRDNPIVANTGLCIASYADAPNKKLSYRLELETAMHFFVAKLLSIQPGGTWVHVGVPPS